MSEGDEMSTKDDGSQTTAQWAAENMTHVVVYGNRSGGGDIEYTGEPTTIEDASKQARRKRDEGWDFAYAAPDPARTVWH